MSPVPSPPGCRCVCVIGFSNHTIDSQSYHTNGFLQGARAKGAAVRRQQQLGRSLSGWRLRPLRRTLNAWRAWCQTAVGQRGIDALQRQLRGRRKQGLADVAQVSAARARELERARASRRAQSPLRNPLRTMGRAFDAAKARIGGRLPTLRRGELGWSQPAA
eukprot:COSAG01_NODE_1225_length_11135_cov_32.660750_7_plen_162_part_00